jgi:hypothetical protein
VPVVVSNGKHSTTYYAWIHLLAFDAAGRFVGVLDKQSTSQLPFGSPATSFNGAVVTVGGGKYAPDLGFIRSPYYRDHQAFDVNLDALIAQGIRSIAVAMIPHAGYRLARFRRKAVRIVDADSNLELGLSHVAAPWVGLKWSMLAGGIVFVNDGWRWLPAGDLVANRDVPVFGRCWFQRLLQAQCVVAE